MNYIYGRGSSFHKAFEDLRFNIAVQFRCSEDEIFYRWDTERNQHIIYCKNRWEFPFTTLKSSDSKSYIVQVTQKKIE